jgi:hypothetical protein
MGVINEKTEHEGSIDRVTNSGNLLVGSSSIDLEKSVIVRVDDPSGAEPGDKVEFTVEGSSGEFLIGQPGEWSDYSLDQRSVDTGVMSSPVNNSKHTAGRSAGRTGREDETMKNHR